MSDSFMLSGWAIGHQQWVAVTGLRAGRMYRCRAVGGGDGAVTIDVRPMRWWQFWRSDLQRASEHGTVRLLIPGDES